MNRLHSGLAWWAQSRYLPLACALLAVALTLPSLWAGWVMDDYHHRAALLAASRPAALDPAVLPGGNPLGLFCFMDGKQDHFQRQLANGTVPWWTWPGIRASFFRPLSALTHAFDYHLWPDSPLLMHLHSLFWLGLLVGLAALFYRQISGAGPAVLIAAFGFALDDAHGLPAAWIANRNALIAGVFGVAALWAHAVGPRERHRRAALAAPGLFLLALLAGESGVGTLAYLVAYAAFLAPGALRARVRSILPYLLLLGGWRLAAVAAGSGVRGMDFYIDPAAEPLRFLQVIPERAPLLLLGQWTPLPADIGLFLSSNGYHSLWLAAIVVALGLTLLYAPVLRRDPRARFWAAGMLLSLVPLCATFPSNRLLLFPGLGAMGLLGLLAEALPDKERYPAPRHLRGAAFCLGIALLLVHGPFAALRLRGEAALTSLRSPQIYLQLPNDPALTSQSVQVVNGPFAFFALEFPFMQAGRGLPVPHGMRVLFPSLAAMSITRPDERTLLLRPDGGYLATPIDASYRSRHHPFMVGDRIPLPELELEVTRVTREGRPAEIRCRYREPLDAPTLRWVYWQDGAYRPFPVPPVGRTVQLPAAVPAW